MEASIFEGNQQVPLVLLLPSFTVLQEAMTANNKEDTRGMAVKENLIYKLGWAFYLLIKCLHRNTNTKA